MTLDEIKTEFAALGVCWTARGALVDGGDPRANPDAINTAAAAAGGAAAVAAGMTAGEFAVLARNYLDGDVDGWLALLS